MPDDGSVTLWIAGMQAGDEQATQKIWERYFERLVRLARDRMRSNRPAGAARDEEDVALSVMNSVCVGVARGKFPKLGDRGELWGLLVVVAARKALNLVRDEGRQKRGGGRVRTETDLRAGDDQTACDRAVGREPTPELAALFAEAFQQRLDSLADDTLRQIALSRLEGDSNDEIAARLGCTVRTVARKLEVIRRHWSVEASR